MKPTRSTNSTETSRRSAAAGSRAERRCGAARPRCEPRPALAAELHARRVRRAARRARVRRGSHRIRRRTCGRPRSASSTLRRSRCRPGSLEVTIPRCERRGCAPSSREPPVEPEARSCPSGGEFLILVARCRFTRHLPNGRCVPRVVTALVGVTLAAWVLVVARMRGMDAGPGTDLGSSRLVSRHLGDDDGGDDAALGDADGAALLEGCVEGRRGGPASRRRCS